MHLHEGTVTHVSTPPRGRSTDEENAEAWHVECHQDDPDHLDRNPNAHCEGCDGRWIEREDGSVGCETLRPYAPATR